MGIKKMISNKKAQITIFIIIAILIVSAIILFVLFRDDVSPLVPTSGEKNPREFIRDCLEDDLIELKDVILRQGGYVDPKLYLEFENEKVAYLCYNSGFYLPCINQEAMLIDHLKKEINENVDNKVEDCLGKLKSSLEKAGYDVGLDYKDFNVELAPENIILYIDAELTAKKNKETTNEKTFVIYFPSRIYELGIVAQEITSQEAKYCNFETVGYMLLYTDFNIKKFKTGTLDIFYSITHKKTKERFDFFVRGCVIPPGF